ncbi:MAG: hypothetical protein ABEI96_10855 [Haloarculaceae archaeon]
MSTNVTDDTHAEPVEDEQRRRYAELTIGDDEYVVYDRENHHAWIQSTVAVPVDELD